MCTHDGAIIPNPREKTMKIYLTERNTDNVFDVTLGPGWLFPFYFPLCHRKANVIRKQDNHNVILSIVKMLSLLDTQVEQYLSPGHNNSCLQPGALF